MIAVLATEIVFPSPAVLLVKRMVFGGSPGREYRMDVRNFRYASVINVNRRFAVTGLLLGTQSFESNGALRAENGIFHFDAFFGRLKKSGTTTRLDRKSTRLNSSHRRLSRMP